MIDRIEIRPLHTKVTGWRRFLPPSAHPVRWEVAEHLNTSYTKYGDTQWSDIVVPKGFIFDGASVPWLLRLIIPRTHPSYIKAAALHDWMIERGIGSRLDIDWTFREQLKQQDMPILWASLMYYAVRVGVYLRPWKWS